MTKWAELAEFQDKQVWTMDPTTRSSTANSAHLVRERDEVHLCKMDRKQGQ